MRRKIIDRPLRPGLQGVRDTVRAIMALAKIGSRTDRVRRIAKGISRRSIGETLGDLDRVAREHIHYVLDPWRIELVQGVDALEESGQGDCDDFSVFLGAIGLALGVPVRITVVRTGSHKTFNHVFPEFKLSGAWYPVDATQSEVPPGQVPPLVREFRSWNFP